MAASCCATVAGTGARLADSTPSTCQLPVSGQALEAFRARQTADVMAADDPRQ